MGVYIGYIKKKYKATSLLLYFKPLAKLQEAQVVVLSVEEQKELLSDSANLNIYFSVLPKDQEKIDKLFPEMSLVIFEFMLEDLQPNINSKGERELTGYKIPAMEMVEQGKIRPLHTAGVYDTVCKDKLRSDFYSDEVVILDIPYAPMDSQIFVELDGFWAGPYQVKYQSAPLDITNSYNIQHYIQPQIAENQYTISGYPQKDVQLLELTVLDEEGEDQEKKWTLLIPKPEAILCPLEVTSQTLSLENFCDSLQGDRIDKDKIRLEGTLQEIIDSFSQLLIKCQDKSMLEKWLQKLLERQPDLIENSKFYQIGEQLGWEADEKWREYTDLNEKVTEKQEEADRIRQAVMEAKAMKLQLDEECTKLSAKWENLKKELDILEPLANLKKMQDDCEEEVKYLKTRKSRLETEIGRLELQFTGMLSDAHEKMAGLAFDGFMASKMLHAAAQWETEEAACQHKELFTKMDSLSIQDKSPQELIDYLCGTIQLVRPTYSKNTILNIGICLTQGFLTVFSGEPGCGKTSICNIFGEVLGLNKIAKYIDCPEEAAASVKRYVPVSVEKGWTSKRDFVGYFNPLSKTFDKSNRRVYEALYQLDMEKRQGSSQLPYLFLLDEANLSPMEYYWSDFMNLCDELDAQSQVNLGEDYVFGIPETLRFFATLNNDHTTETLSPRLIDRAWIISLPYQEHIPFSEEEIPWEQIQIISWPTLCQAFLPRKEECVLSAHIQKVYDAVLAKLKEKRFFVSPRIHKAIKRYWAAAAKWFECETDDSETDNSEIVALDYAIAQRILPKITGHGEKFKEWLEELEALCAEHQLRKSRSILKNIIECEENQQMQYYHFFCSGGIM